MSDHHQMRARGDAGEEAVVQFLQAHRCTIVFRNFVSEGGEIDIIAENEARLLFVEVKSRQVTSDMLRWGRPASAVTRDKQRRILSAASAYLRRCPTEKQIRFDVAEVFLTKGEPPEILDINYIKGAFIKQKGRNSYE
ncbi:MAG: YraN family protein [Clostridia bacterium]|nr:YraN family protein [Clostridia bacterium]